MQTHGNEHQSIAYALAGISQDLGHTAVALETSIAVFNADTRFGQSSVVLFLCWGQFLSGFSLLFALAFDGGDHHGLAHFEPLKAAIGTDENGSRTGEGRLIQDLLIMFAAMGFFACRQDILGFRMREGDVLLGMTLLLPRIRFFLLLGVFRAADGP